jgi:hypothetical protein
MQIELDQRQDLDNCGANNSSSLVNDCFWPIVACQEGLQTTHANANPKAETLFSVLLFMGISLAFTHRRAMGWHTD